MQGYTAIKSSTLERCYPPVETAQNLTSRPGAEGYVKLQLSCVQVCMEQSNDFYTPPFEYLHSDELVHKYYFQKLSYVNKTSKSI